MQTDIAQSYDEVNRECFIVTERRVPTQQQWAANVSAWHLTTKPTAWLFEI
jgi:hypothetical protein